ncbi:MAG: DUF1641 domain-containing protein [Anaerolineae bacterium]
MATMLNTPNSTAAEHLLERLNDPTTVRSLDQILDNIELIAFSVSAVDGFIRRSEAVTENVVEGVIEMKAAAPNSANLLGLLPRILEMLPQMLDLAERLTVLSKTPEFQRLLDIISNPETLNAIVAIMNNIELLSTMVTAIDGFLRRSDTIIDNVASSVSEVTQSTSLKEFSDAAAALPELVKITPRFIAALPQLLDVGKQLQPLLESPEFAALMQSGLFAPKTVAVVGQAGDALVESYEQHHQDPKSLGLFGLLRALNDPDIQRALGFAAGFGKQFGKKV